LHGVGHPQLVSFFQALPRIDHLPEVAEGTVYMQRPNLVRELSLPAGLQVPWSRLVVKRFGWRGLQHYLFSPLKRSRAMKAYRTACHLLTHRLATPLPLAVFEERRWGFVQYNVYATEAITDYITLRQYRRTLPDGAEGLPDVLQLAADYTRRMHDSGLWHRDMVLSNFLLAGRPGHRRLYLVDLNRAYRLPYVPAWLRAIDIARMDWEAWHPQFVERYCGDRYATRRMLRLVRLYRRWRTLRRHVLDGIKPIRRRLRL
jgi:tRNA A-37 threonylcarbamoyl transferase component Bud32